MPNPNSHSNRQQTDRDATDDVCNRFERQAVSDQSVGFPHEGGEGGVGADEADADGHLCRVGEDVPVGVGEKPAEKQAAGDVDDEGAEGKSGWEKVLAEDSDYKAQDRAD